MLALERPYSAEEAATITELGREYRPQYPAKCGNTYSSGGSGQKSGIVKVDSKCSKL